MRIDIPDVLALAVLLPASLHLVRSSGSTEDEAVREEVALGPKLLMHFGAHGIGGEGGLRRRRGLRREWRGVYEQLETERDSRGSGYE